MWLPKYMAQNTKKPQSADIGGVTSAGEGQVFIDASKEYRSLPVVVPFGIAYIPPTGENSVVLPLSSGEVCLGVTMKDKNLAAGELMLFSSGGASIILKNDGSVLINGKTF
ncbi:MAG: hypothetical protein Q8876_00135 [Bacillota bacterium]|nr:hypothetical protein [Bacillota bacterium]